MKPIFPLRSLLIGSSFLSALPMLHATDLYWDTNSTAAGFGTSPAGIWGTNTYWSTTSDGTGSTANTTTTTSDNLIFGTSTDGFSTSAQVTFSTGGKSAGTITTGSANTGTVTINNGSALTMGAAAVFNVNSSTGGLSVAGVLAGAATSFIKNGSGTLSFSGITNTWTGVTTINSGVLQGNFIGNGGINSSIGAASNSAANLVLNGGTLGKFGTAQLGNTDRLFTLGDNGGGLQNTDANNAFNFTNTGSVAATGTANRTLTLGGSGSSNTLAPILTDASGGGLVSVVKNGTNTWSLTSTTNSYSGGTTVNQGTLSFGSTGLMGATTGTLSVNNTNSTTAGTATVLNLATGQNTTTGSLSGTIATPTSGTNTATINIANTRTLTVNQTTSGTYAGVIAGSGGDFTLGASSTNTLTLSGINTYTGATLISGGTLAVNGSLANTSSVTVQTGATLQGSGSISSSVTIQGNGTLASGNSIESLGTGALTFDANSTLAYQLNNDAAAGVAGDLTYVTGNLTLSLTNDSILTLNELGAGSWSNGDKLTLISYTGSWNGGLFDYLGIDVADDSQITFSGSTWILNYNDSTEGTNYTTDSTGNFVTMTVIPEPSTALLISSGLLFLIRRRR